MTKTTAPKATPYIKAKIRRLSKEITEIDDFFYHSDRTGDQLLYASMLERKRDDMVRAAVLQLHTSIEDVLTSWITCRVFGVNSTQIKVREKTKAGRALHKMLHDKGSLGFDMKLNFAVALGLITTVTQGKLAELNTLRNKCSHNWLLRVPVRRRRRPRQKKQPLLTFRGGNLHDAHVLRELVGEYGLIYARMFVKYLDG
jgi:hypothetical protein